MTEIMPVPRILILLSYQQGALKPLFCLSLQEIQIHHIIIFVNACHIIGVSYDLCRSFSVAEVTQRMIQFLPCFQSCCAF
ncbi:hypothetical protein SAMN02910435_02229 [Ruminococcaceae bacterium D5]|nr:hypothetical protein SAMN02910435_02229 [Ruminococcaceae bacterium D5]